MAAKNAAQARLSAPERAALRVNHGGIVYQMLVFGLSFEAILVFVVDAQNL
jgi:hypothetical protein